MAEEDYTNHPESNGENLEQSEIQQLTKEISYLTNQLRFDAKAKGMIAGSLVGYAFGKSFEEKLAFMIGGGILGAKLPIRELTEEDKKSYLAGIQVRQQRVEYLKALERGHDVNRGPAKMSADGLDTILHEYYRFSPRWQNFIGNPSKNFHAIIFGPPKQGKSILAIQLADEVSKYGRALYIAAEEGLGATLKQKVQDFAPDMNNNLEFSNWKNLKEIEEGLAKDPSYAFVFIDSISKARITVEDMEALKKKFPAIAWITIMQSTKEGQFRGSQEYAHDCDIVINVSNGIATQQGRFCAGSELNVFAA